MLAFSDGASLSLCDVPSEYENLFLSFFRDKADEAKEYAAFWEDSGFTISECAKWFRSGCYDPDIALEFVGEDIKPRVVAQGLSIFDARTGYIPGYRLDTIAKLVCDRVITVSQAEKHLRVDCGVENG